MAGEIPDRERKRQEAIFEFIATEIAYVRDLQLIVEVRLGVVYYTPKTTHSYRRT